jgi:proton-translocating NADH-quinone oxidoreductase chain N
MPVFNELSWLVFLPLMAAPLVYLVGRIIARRLGDSSPSNPARWLALAVVLIDFIPLFAAGQRLADGRLDWQIGMVRLGLDGLGLLLAVVVLGLGLAVLLFSVSYMEGEVGEEKFYALLVAMMGTMIGLGCARDLFNLWIWFEAMAVTSYMLVAFYREQASSLEAGFKYLTQSAVGSVLVLLGISLVRAGQGTLDIDTITQMNARSILLLPAGVLFLIGFGVKAAIVPMHTWLPDAHSQAPSGISAMLSGVVIEAGLVALLRVFVPVILPGDRFYTWGEIILAMAIINMLVGNLMALRQTQVKRLLAYSSVSHMGYILLGIGVALIYGSQDAAAGAFFHVLTHAAMKGLAFLSAGALLFCLHLSRGEHSPLVLDDLNGAARRYPLAAFCLSIAVLGLGGLPPLAGFMSKWQIFVAGVGTGDPGMIGLVLFAALNSVLSLGYYAPLVNRLYRYTAGPAAVAGEKMPVSLALPLVLLAVVVIGLGVYPALATVLTTPAAQAMLMFP